MTHLQNLFESLSCLWTEPIQRKEAEIVEEGCVHRPQEIFTIWQHLAAPHKQKKV
jgi:hypothetical protein